MKRWVPWFVLVMIAVLAVIAYRPSPVAILRDTDTVGLLQGIREQKAPLSWFTSDWPIQNHFYRPVSTLTLELDNALYGDAPAGYGLTNAIVAGLAILALFWLLREATDRPAVAGLGALLFASYHLPTAAVVVAATWLGYASYLCFAGLWRGGKAQLSKVAIGFLVTQFVSSELARGFGFYGRIVGWVPGRTASTMAVFALCALAAYLRYERTSATLAKPEPGPLDPPATKGTVSRRAFGNASIAWVLLAWLLTALAMGCYEQAVMLPTVAVCLAVGVRILGYRTRWWPHVGFWCVLALYIAVRLKYVPVGPSGYQAQQMRHGLGGVVDMIGWLTPGILHVQSAVDTLSTSVFILLTAPFWSSVIGALSNAGAWISAVKQRRAGLLVVALVAASLAFLPMSFLKYFEHYLYWPAALRTMYLLVLLGVAAKAWASAVALPVLQAPLRQRPAPGSLPRP